MKKEGDGLINNKSINHNSKITFIPIGKGYKTFIRVGTNKYPNKTLYPIHEANFKRQIPVQPLDAFNFKPAESFNAFSPIHVGGTRFVIAPMPVGGSMISSYRFKRLDTNCNSKKIAPFFQTHCS